MRRRYSGVVVFSLAAIGCNAKIKVFSADPRFICPGQQVILSWDVVGSARLTISPQSASAPDGDVKAKDHVTLHPKVQTRASLHVTRFLGESTGADIDIDISAPSAPVRVAADLNDAARCENGVLTLTAHLSQFAPGVKAQLVAVEEGEQRSYDITRMDPAQHAITAHVGPGVSTTAFANLPMAGDWLLSSRLTDQEACPTEAKPGKIPHVLTVNAYSSCHGERS